MKYANYSAQLAHAERMMPELIANTHQWFAARGYKLVSQFDDEFVYEPTNEEPMKLSIQEALVIKERISDGTSLKRAMHRAAEQVLTGEATRLMAQAVGEAAPPTLVDIQVYDGTHDWPCLAGHRWVRRAFSDGNVTKAQEPGAFAEQLHYTFHAGKKAGEQSKS